MSHKVHYAEAFVFRELTARSRAQAYLPRGGLAALWDERLLALGAQPISRGQSVEGRPLMAYALGPQRPAHAANAPSLLLTGLLHGVELIGSVALLHAVEALCQAGLQRELNLVVAPVLNPDALAFNCARLARGERAWRRCNSRRVDLNRNFGRVGSGRHWHPFSGSSLAWAPHYAGPEPFSEPESRWLAQLAQERRPTAALGFHSFGELLLYPWGHTAARHPRAAEYEALAGGFAGAQPRPYQVKQAFGFYPTHGDLDDWLDHELGTLALTVEVGNLSRRLLRPSLALNPFWWMNPLDVEQTVANVVPGVLAFAQQLTERYSADRDVPTAAPSPASSARLALPHGAPGSPLELAQAAE